MSDFGVCSRAHSLLCIFLPLCNPFRLGFGSLTRRDVERVRSPLAEAELRRA